jgi:hypothetical protein
LASRSERGERPEELGAINPPLFYPELRPGQEDRVGHHDPHAREPWIPEAAIDDETPHPSRDAGAPRNGFEDGQSLAARATAPRENR